MNLNDLSDHGRVSVDSKPVGNELRRAGVVEEVGRTLKPSRSLRGECVESRVIVRVVEGALGSGSEHNDVTDGRSEKEEGFDVSRGHEGNLINDEDASDTLKSLLKGAHRERSETKLKVRRPVDTDKCARHREQPKALASIFGTSGLQEFLKGVGFSTTSSAGNRTDLDGAGASAVSHGVKTLKKIRREALGLFEQSSEDTAFPFAEQALGSLWLSGVGAPGAKKRVTIGVTETVKGVQEELRVGLLSKRGLSGGSARDLDADISPMGKAIEGLVPENKSRADARTDERGHTVNRSLKRAGEVVYETKDVKRPLIKAGRR
jgi:hypothetical protein